METKDRNREAAQKRKPQEEQRRRRPPQKKEERRAAPAKKTAAKPAAEKTAQRRRPEEQEKSRRDSQPRQRREQPVKSAPPRRQTSDKSDAYAAYAQRREKPENIPFSAPQGTGPRKSAPQMNAQETAATRRQQRNRPKQPPKAEKKNALQNLISGVRGNHDVSEEAAARAEKRRKERAARAEKKRKQAERNDTPAIIYTQPMAFSRDRLLIQLLTVTAVVAALVLGMSVFFKVKTITVAGAETYSAWAIREASGIKEGDSLLTFSKPKAGAKIQAELSYVDDVRIGIKLPDTVIIYIEELDVSYAVESNQGDWWLINSEGRIVEQITELESNNHTKVLGVRLEDPSVGNTAVAADDVPQETLASGEPVPLSVTGAQRLSSALQILKALEANDIVGQAASVDVSSLDDVTLMYGSRYEVLLGDTTRMDYKIACMNDTILELSEYQSGILDISFTIWPDQVGYTPFG